VRNDPVDPATRSFSEIMRLLDRLPQSFPFRGTIIGAVPKPITKVGPLELDPVGPLNFGFKWGVDPVFDLTSVGRKRAADRSGPTRLQPRGGQARPLAQPRAGRLVLEVERWITARILENPVSINPVDGPPVGRINQSV
jgi:hypothetical protein